MAANEYSYQTDRLRLSVLDERDAQAVLDYYNHNRDFHQLWFSFRGKSVFTLDHQRQQLGLEYNAFLSGRSLPLYVFATNDPGRIIGRVAFTNIIRGSFQSCFLGYSLAEQSVGHGYAFEAITAALNVIFSDFRLHRVEANIMPHNARSISLAQRLGFRLEGISRRYLEINGRWEDHLRYVRLNEPEFVTTSEVAELKGERIIVRQLDEPDIPAIIKYYERNREWLSQFNPATDPSFLTSAYWQKQVAQQRCMLTENVQLDLGIFLPDKPDYLAGMISFSNFEPLPYSTCELGFSIDKLLAGRGFMFEALLLALNYIFAGYGVNKVNARVLPRHEQSLRLLNLLGFQTEGSLRQEIKLHDKFETVSLLSLLSEEFAVN
ncbi:MAG: GNAT family N-acetyltransferase [Ruminococcaceae bacterium]|nr:GNAT family N-acetyltransferase [Oscillospiraceae bacterium]